MLEKHVPNLNTSSSNALDHWRQKAIDAHNSGGYREAINFYDLILSQQKENVDILCYKGKALHALGQYFEAITYFDRALRLQPDNAKAIYGKALAFHFLGEYKTGLYYYEWVCQLQPNNEEALSNIGAILFCLKQYEDAKNIFIKLHHVNPNNIYIDLYSAATHAYNKDYQAYSRTIETINKQLSSLPRAKMASTCCIYGDMLVAVYLLEEAEKIYSLIKQSLPEFIYAQKRLAEVQKLLESKQEHSWEFPKQLVEIAEGMAKERGYSLIPATPYDIGKVIQLYQHNPVPGYELKRVELIYNPEQNLIFSQRIKLLNNRGQPENTAFRPLWEDEPETLKHVGWRRAVADLNNRLAAPYTDNRYPNVKLMPIWHGTKDIVLDSLFRTGYATFGTNNTTNIVNATDCGWFGRGYYGTLDAQYAYSQYAELSGPLIINWTCYYSAYPVIDGDKSKLKGKANYQNYDAHFVVIDQDMNPAKNLPNYSYTELVVFDSSQCIPRYLVELQPTLCKSLPQKLNLSGNPHMLFRTVAQGITYRNLLAAIDYVYEKYLSQAYTLATNKSDWEFAHNGKCVPRPNHGLANTLRKMFYVPWVIEAYLQYHDNQLSVQDVKILRTSLHEIQLVLLFYTVGRENESSWNDDKDSYERFRKRSEQALREFIDSSNIQMSSEKITSYFHNDFVPGHSKKHENNIISICHNLDLLRCYSYQEFYTAVYPRIDKEVGLQAQNLLKLARICLERTGDRILCGNSNNEPVVTYKGDIFIEVNTNIHTCLKTLTKAVQLWQQQVFNTSNNLTITHK